MEKIVEQGLLYDFYGELLTAHLLKRCTNSLEGYEKKLHMIERTDRIRKQLGDMKAVVSDKELQDNELRARILEVIESITEELS